METFVVNCSKSDWSYKKKDGLGDDRSRGLAMPASWTHEEQRQRRMLEHRWKDRFHRLIHGDWPIPIPHTWNWVACEVCGQPKKVRRVPKKKEALTVALSECFNNFSTHHIDHPNMQKRFDEWKREMSESVVKPEIKKVMVRKILKTKKLPSAYTKKMKDPSKEVVERPDRGRVEKRISDVTDLEFITQCIDFTTPRRPPRKPHHHYHHKFIEKKPSTPERKDQILTCTHCPDPYRNWVRRKTGHHLYCKEHLSLPVNPKAVEYFGYSRRSELRTESERTLKDYYNQMKTESRNVSALKESLKTILKGNY